ncbi:MAG: MFS transporter [Saprospiraceae bacterium]|nr:MAG: MFS transporter [Saprospiraceae bacterium]
MEILNDTAPKSSPKPLNDKKVINAWALFDWANSAFALVITVAIFPGYFVKITDEQINIFGLEVTNSSLYAFSISAAYLIIAIASPFLSGIADYGGKKKFFLKFFTTFGAIGCISLFFFTDASQWLIGTIGFIMGMIGFAGGLVFYNAYLPLIVTEDRYDSVSARGFAFGYIGSILLLCINLAIILNPGWLGISEESTLAVRISFLMVGLWWIGFAMISFRFLPEDDKGKPSGKLIGKGFKELQKVWGALKYQTNIKSFLISFFCYSAGVQTVLYLASTFAEKELHFETSELIMVVLLLQVVAIGGAYLFAKISEWKGNKLSLIIMLIIWTAICFVAYLVQNKIQFYGVAAAVGVVMGGIQSLSRSTYSKLLPPNTEDTTSYFSFYDVLEKTAIILGTFTFGYLDLITGSMRNSVLILAVFFVISLILLTRVKVVPAEVKEMEMG